MRRESVYTPVGSHNNGMLFKAWRNNKVLILILGSILLLIIIALAVGLAIGLNHLQNSNDSSTDINSALYNATHYTGWQPEAGSTFQIVLLYQLNDTSSNAQVYDIDLFTNTVDTISTLHGLGSKVICYFSAGTYEDFRPDSNQFQKSDYGKPLGAWPGEWWLDTNSTNVRNIMTQRIELALSKGCDGVDPDNMDGYENDTGLDLTQGSAVDYLSFLANAAHARNISIGLKNGGYIINQTLDMVQWQVDEQCEKYNECAMSRPFIDAGKPVFHIEYPASAPDVNASTKASICDNESAAGFSTVLKKMNLDDWVEEC